MKLATLLLNFNYPKIYPLGIAGKTKINYRRAYFFTELILVFPAIPPIFPLYGILGFNNFTSRFLT
jgi:hypothetical protein